MMMIGPFVEVCSRGLKVNADRGRVMLTGREERPVCEISVEGGKLERISEFKY